MEWDKIPGASGYELEVTRILKSGSRKKPLFFKSKKPAWAGRVVAGRYEVRLRTTDSRGVAGEWSPPIEVWARFSNPKTTSPKVNETINTKSDDDTDIKFTWEAAQGAQAYWLEVRVADGDTVFSDSVRSLDRKLSLKVAQAYEWRVGTLMPEEDKRDLSDLPFQSFSLIGEPLKTPVIEKPESKFVTELEWSRPNYADTFKYRLERKGPTGWKKLEDGDKIATSKLLINPQYEGGQWRLTVIAQGPLRQPSKPAILEFYVYEGIRTPEAIERAKLREAIEREYDRLFIASYLLSSIDYSGRNYNTRKNANFSALTGTGRLGLGYIPNRKNWGIIGKADLSGMIIGEKNHLFYSGELQGVWRKYIWEVTQLRLYAGLFARQLPEAVRLADGSLKVQDVSALGPHGGLQFWHPFTYRLGMQVNIQLLSAMMAIKTPSGRGISPTLSYQLGVMGSYKLKDNITGFAGYAYRNDKISYQAKPFDGSDPANLANSGDINSVAIEGHYLNLLLEWGF